MYIAAHNATPIGVHVHLQAHQPMLSRAHESALTCRPHEHNPHENDASHAVIPRASQVDEERTALIPTRPTSCS